MDNGTSSCIEWMGCVQSNGYGRRRFKGKTEYAHRVAYVEAYGEIPEGYDVCHRCDNRRCINPDHLFAGTRKDNMRDCVAKGRQAKGDKLPQCKVAPEDRPKLFAMREDGKTYKEIGAAFGITRHQASYIVRGIYAK